MHLGRKVQTLVSTRWYYNKHFMGCYFMARENIWQTLYFLQDRHPCVSFARRVKGTNQAWN